MHNIKNLDVFINLIERSNHFPLINWMQWKLVTTVCGENHKISTNEEDKSETNVSEKSPLSTLFF